MAKVFVSYSRKDIEIAKRLTAELQKSDLDFWIDWEGIPPTVDWWKEIEKGIEEADIFLFLISPDSSKSKVCLREIDHAVRNGKRLIPVVVREIDIAESPGHLSHINWIFFRPTDDFDTSISRLLTSIRTDYEWVQAHRRLQVKALEWERNNRENSFLLRGKDLEDAEFQLATNTSKEPHPTNLQREYVFRSRRAADTQRRIFAGISFAGIIALAALAVFGFVQANNANLQAAAAQVAQNDAQSASTLAVSNASTAVANEQQARMQSRIARTRELASLAMIKRPTNYELSLLLGLEVFNRMPDLRSARGIMLNGTQMNPQLIQYLAGHRGFVYSVAFSPDGKILASGSNDKTIILWDMATGQQIGQPLAGSSGAYSIAFSPDGKILAAANVDDTIYLWDVVSQKLVRNPVRDDMGGVNSLAFSSDGETLAWGRGDGSIILWDLVTGQRIGNPLTGHKGAIWKVIFSPDGRLLASSSEDATVILWDVAKHQPIGEPLRGHDSTVWSLAFSPDGKVLASGGDDKSIILWDVATQQPIQDPLVASSGVYALAFSPDGKTLAAGYAGNDLILWDTGSRRTIGQPFRGHSNWINSLAFSPDGKTIASGSQDDTIILWSAAPREASAATLTEHGAVHGVAFSPDGKLLASGGAEGAVLLMDAATHQPMGEPLQGHTDVIWSIRFSPDGRLLASAGADRTIILWDVAKRVARGKPLSGHTGTIWSVAFSPDGQTLASGADDGTAILWDTATGQSMGKPFRVNPGGAVYSVAFSPDGKTLATASDDGTITLWDVATQQPTGERLVGGHGGVLYSTVFSPDGKLLVAGGDEGNILLWDLATFNPTGKPLAGHSAIYSLAFSPDGNMLAAGTLDGSINLWDVATLEVIAGPLTGHRDYVNSLAFSPDGKALASGSADGSLRLWNLDPQVWVEQTCQRVGRNFTLTEWTFYFPTETYRKTCPQWPLETEDVAVVAVNPVIELLPPMQVSTAEVTPTPVSNPDRAYTEEFDGNLDTWSGFMTTGVKQQVTTALENSTFRVRLASFQDMFPWAYWINESFTYTDVQLQAVVTNNGNNANGVSLICQRNDHGWYEFTVSSAGLYTIYVFDPSLPPLEGHIALATGGSHAIKSGNATNTYTATCRGNQLSLIINGSAVRTVTDTLYEFTEGKIGIGVSSPQRLPVDVQFDSLTVSVPE